MWKSPIVAVMVAACSLAPTSAYAATADAVIMCARLMTYNRAVLRTIVEVNESRLSSGEDIGCALSSQPSDYCVGRLAVKEATDASFELLNPLTDLATDINKFVMNECPVDPRYPELVKGFER